MGKRILAAWVAVVSLPVLLATACISPTKSAPLSDDAGQLANDAGPPDAPVLVDAPFIDSPPLVDSPPPVDSPADSPADAGPPVDATPPCAANNGGCDPHATCANGEAGAICTCDPGFAGNGLTCASDCVTKNGGCDPHASCANGDAGVVCTCNAGFAGNGTTCASDCATSNGGCDPNATCSNGDAGVLCACNPGFTGTGLTCASDCLTNNGGCDPNAACSNAAAGVVCVCNLGFTGNGTSCANNDYTEWPAPSDAPPETEYTVSADGTIVTDSVTGLVWQRQVFANPCPADAADAGTSGCTWADAQSYCASLDGLALGGISTGWRVPSIVELLSIVNYGDGTPALDTAIFPATPTVAFWAHTPNASNAAQAWSVSFATGLDATQAITAVSPVRCVTSVPAVAITPTCGVGGDACCYANSCGPDLACNASVCAVDGNYEQGGVPSDTPLESSSTVSADGSIVTDKVTGLVWQRQIFASPPACAGDGTGVCTLSHASAYCASLSGLSLGGVTSGWRLPTVVELLSIANFAAGSPALDTALFPGTPPAHFWTQTANASNAAQAWIVDFNTGLDGTQATTVASAVRCVSAVAPSATPACGGNGETCCYAGSCGPDLTCNAATSCIVDGDYAQTTVPSDTPPEPPYTVSPGGSTVTDPVTGLIWQRPLLANPCTSDAGPGGCTWTGAAAYCDSLNALTLGGYSAGWRLPTVAELVSIANFSATPTIDPAPFPATPASSFWSGTANASNAAQAWTFSYATGVNASQPTTSTFEVRCVNASVTAPAAEGCGTAGQSCCYANSCGATLLCAGGTCITDPDYTLGTVPPDVPPTGQYATTGPTVTDTVTGVVWALSPGGANPCTAGSSLCTWPQAGALCASLNLGGFSSGWRQPSVVELLSIVNYAVTSGAKVDTGIFVGTTAAPHWSSTPAGGGGAQAWTVDFSTGLDSLVTTSTALAPACVH